MICSTAAAALSSASGATPAKPPVGNLVVLTDYLARNNFRGVLEDEALFITLYGKALEQCKDKVDAVKIAWSTFRDPEIYTKTRSNEIFFSAFNEGTTRIFEIQDVLQLIRREWLHALNTGEKVFRLIALGTTYPFSYRFTKDCQIIKESALSQEKIYTPAFVKYVLPCLPVLAEMMGTTFIQVDAFRESHFEGYANTQSHVQVLTFQLDKDFHHVYAIPPLPYQARGKLEEKCYALLPNKTRCDLKLISNGVELDIHSLILFSRGGETFERMLEDNMKEKKECIIRLDQFSINTLRAFVDYLYLGSEGLIEKLKQSSKYDYDLSNLLEFAHTYQVPGLIDCSLNLFSLFSTKEDLPILESLALRYENAFLQKLVQHFKGGKGATLLKV